MTDRFDDAVDRAVREMLDVEPRADLRARVMAQLPAAGFQLPASGWTLASLAVAALIVLAVFVARRSETPQAPVVAHGVDRHLPSEIAPPAPAAGAPAPVVTRSMPPQALRAAADRGMVVAASDPGSDNATTDIEPLRTIAPIAVSPIAQDTIAPANVAVRPLNTIAEVQISPLTPPDRRD